MFGERWTYGVVGHWDHETVGTRVESSLCHGGEEGGVALSQSLMGKDGDCDWSLP